MTPFNQKIVILSRGPKSMWQIFLIFINKCRVYRKFLIQTNVDTQLFLLHQREGNDVFIEEEKKWARDYIFTFAKVIN